MNKVNNVVTINNRSLLQLVKNKTITYLNYVSEYSTFSGNITETNIDDIISDIKSECIHTLKAFKWENDMLVDNVILVS